LSARADTVPDVCFGLWLSEDGTRALQIAREGDAVIVTVWRRADGLQHLALRPATWHAPDPSASASPDAKRRLGYLQVEVDTPGLGSTYDLMLACRNADPSQYGGFDWRPAPPEFPREHARLFPQGGASYYEAVLGAWDDFVEPIRSADRWMEPLSTWRPATAEEVGDGGRSREPRDRRV
jgi:hypothetical protein